MNKQMGTVFAALVAMCLLSGCAVTELLEHTGQSGQLQDPSSTEEASTSPVSDALPEPTQTDVPALHFASGDLILGDFDYEAIKDNMFDPCEEISEEEFATVGLKTAGNQSWRVAGKVGCGLFGPDVRKGYAIGTTPVTRAQVESVPEDVISSSASDTIPGLLTYRGENPATFGCVAAVDTVRGQFSVAVDQDTQPDSLDSLCESAVQIMETFYQL